jgi:hypothetical protein
MLVSPAMTAPNPHGLSQLRDALRKFAEERDWDQYHSPKNLASALSVEAAELLERFQWLERFGWLQLESLTRASANREGVQNTDALVVLPCSVERGR